MSSRNKRARQTMTTPFPGVNHEHVVIRNDKNILVVIDGMRWILLVTVILTNDFGTTTSFFLLEENPFPL